MIDDDQLPPVIDFTTNNHIPLIGSGYSESHGLTNTIRLDVRDSKSGVASVDVSVHRGSQLLDAFQATSTDTVYLDSYGLGTFRVQVRATDLDADGWAGDASTRVASATLSVTNQAPEVFSGGPYLLREGELLGLRASGSDVDPGDTEQLLYEWDLNDDGAFGDVTGANPVITWQELVSFGIDDDGNYPINARVTDNFGETATSNTVVTVTNAPPQVEFIHADPVIDENSVLTVTGAFTDAGPRDRHEVVVYWGDGSSSAATVDANQRTFIATHHYPDDQPTGTAFDEYIIRVQVTDDDGDQNPARLQAVTVETESTGAIELPAFQTSLPPGVSGRLKSAHVVVDPQEASTTVTAGQAFNHAHTVDYPPSGPFNLPAVSASTSSAVGQHAHDFNLAPQTKTFTGNSLTTYFKNGKTYNMTSQSTVSGSSGLPTDHNHSTGNVPFTTTTTFTYTPPHPKTIVDTGFYGLPSNIDLTGDAHNHYGGWSHSRVDLTDPVGSETGSLLVDSLGEAVRDFTATFEVWIGGGSEPPADGFSFGYGPIPNGAIFGEDGYSGRPGLWVTFDTYDNGGSDLVGVEFWYNGTRIVGYSWTTTSYAADRISTDSWEDVEISITSSGYLTVKHPFFQTGEFSRWVSGWNPSNNWRFGMGARTGGAWEWHAVDTLKIVDKTVRSHTTTVTKSATNKYILPRFDTGLGALTRAVVKLDAGNKATVSSDGGQFMHDHDVTLAVAPFGFGTATATASSAGTNHAHLVDFKPAALDFNSEADLRSLFLQDQNVLLPQESYGSTQTLNHTHEIAAGSVPFHTTTTFTYDATSTVIRVDNSAPEITSLPAPTEILEDGTAVVSGSFTDRGSQDTHRVIFDWGDGSVHELAVLPGTDSFEASHDYADDNPPGTSTDVYTIQVTVVDDDTGSTAVTADLIVTNVPPLLAVGAPDLVAEGSRFELPLATFTDTGRRDTHTAVVDWGDGTTSSGTVIESAGVGVVEADHVFRDNGTYTVRATVRDDDGGTDSQTVLVVVENVAPTINDLRVTIAGSDRKTMRFQATALDAGEDTLTYTWDFGDASAAASGVDLDQMDHAYGADGTYTVRLIVEDDDGARTEQTMTVVVASIVLAGPQQVDEGTAYLLTLGEVIDPNNPPISQYIIDWGDGGEDRYSSSGVVHHIYPDGPVERTIAVTLIDSQGTRTSGGALTVTVHNVRPVISSTSAAETGMEGDELSFSAMAVDPGEDHITYTWDFGDGSAEIQARDLTNVGHRFADDGVYFVSVTVEDDDGAADSRSFPVVVSNVRPTISLTGPSSTDEGALYALTLGDVQDPGDDTVVEWIVDWGDGFIDSYASSGEVSHTYLDGPGIHRILVAVRDEDGTHSDAGTHDVTVDNVAPIIEGVDGDLSGNEGRELSFSARVNDPAGASDLLTFTWDFGDDTAAVSGMNLRSVSHAYADDGRYTGTLRVADDDGGQTETPFEVVVHDVAPLIVVSGSDHIGEGREYLLDFGIITDPGTDVVTEWIVHWGDGSHDNYSEPVTARHFFADGSVDYQIQVELVDEDGAHPGANVVDVTVRNEPPVIVQLAGTQEHDEGDTFHFAADADDSAGSADPLTYAWDFGDGSPEIRGVDLSGVDHVYLDDGQYTVTLIVDDGDGGQARQSLPVVVRNVLPTIELLGETSVIEGALYQLTLGAITDPGRDTVSEWRVNWGDGTSETHDAGGVIEHVYADGPQQFTIDVTLVDEDGTHLFAGLRGIDVNNAPPVIDGVVFSQNPKEGESALFEVQAVDPAGRHDGLTYTWDFGDGSDPVSLESVAGVGYTYADDGIYTIHVVVTDEDGATDTTQFDYAVANVAPTIELVSPTTANEAEAYELTLGEITDPGQDTVTAWIVDWGDGYSETYPNGGTVSHTYPDGPAESIVTVEIVDEDGTYAVGQLDVIVWNSPPEVGHLGGDTSGDEGSQLTFSAAASDPAGAADTLAYTWFFGDGSDPLSDVNLTDVTHTFADDGDYVVKLIVTDEDGSGALDSFDVTVDNVAPSFEAGADETLLPVKQGVLNRTIPFADPGEDDWTGTADFGDDTGNQLLTVNPATREIELAHTYTASGGPYTVVVTLDDSDGGSHTDSFEVEVILAEVEFKQASFTALEGAGTSLVVELERTPVGTTVTSHVLVAITGGTALGGGADYDDSAFPLRVTFTPGVATMSVPVPIHPDNLVELDESVTFVVTSVSNALIVDQDTTTLTIQNDDEAVIDIVGVSADEATGKLDYEVTISNPVDVGVTVRFDTLSTGTATGAGVDFNDVANQVVTFAAGSTTAQTVTVAVNDENIVEPNETVVGETTTLGAGGRNVQIDGGGAADTATGTINN
ncbi:MAG: PKD domain-containing protein, partial [Pirellulales bacterium]